MGRCIWQRCPTENAKEDQIEKHYRNIEDGYVNLVSNLWVGYFFVFLGYYIQCCVFIGFELREICGEHYQGQEQILSTRRAFCGTKPTSWGNFNLYRILILINVKT
jgi:hypothetical protein